MTMFEPDVEARPWSRQLELDDAASRVQSGYLYWYALVMIVGVIGLMTWQLWPFLGSQLSR